MADLARLYDFMPQTLIRSSDVDAEFNQLVAEANKTFSPYRTIFTAAGHIGDGNGGGTYALQSGGGVAVLSGSAGFPAVFHFASADYAVTGRTLKLRLRAQALVNGTAAGMTPTVGLYGFALSGGADSLVCTLNGSPVAGSTVALATPPANTVTQGNSGDFAVPANGTYVAGMATSGTPTADSIVAIRWQLQVRNV